MIRLIIKDISNNHIAINTNKYVLYSLSSYFKNLLTFGKEKDQNEIVIEVNHVGVALNAIKDIYQKPEYEWILETIRQQIYFNISGGIDLSVLERLNIPPEGFDLLMQTLQELNYPITTKLKDLIRRIMPEDYDLGNLPKKFINELVEHKYYLATTSCGLSSVKIWKDMYVPTKLSFVSTQNIQNCEKINFSTDGNLIVCFSRNNIYIHETITGKMINKFSVDEVHFVMFTTDSLVIIHGPKGKINVERYDIETYLSLPPHTLLQYPYTISPDASIVAFVPYQSSSVYVIDVMV